MKRLLFLLIICSVSCQRHSPLELPVVTHSSIEGLKKLPSASIYYNDHEKDSVELKLKRFDLSEDWQMKVDKRLTLRQVIPLIQSLQVKTRDESSEKQQNTKHYYTVKDKSSKNLGFIDFSDVVYHSGIDKQIVESHGLHAISQVEDTNYILSILFKKNDSVAINSANYTKSEFAERLKFMDSIQNKIMGIVYLKFNENLSFQEYIDYKALLSEVNLKHATISRDEYIFH